jgi:succinoglycan biosynthesis protein ExoW
MTIAVVIPFYQREPGLLQAALRSVVAQDVAQPIHVVVVDDASPISAASEVAGVSLRDGVSVQVLQQANAGPAAARNRGLDALRDDVSYVAFLDSDDVWVDDHLRHAVDALAAGHDFFFADLYQPGQTVSAFVRAGRLDAGQHPPIGTEGPCRTYVGDMFDQIISGNVIGTSTVVYDFQRFARQRFDEAFYSAGEDYLFWIACARTGARFCFSTDVEVRYGYGVNVYAGSGWGTDGYLRRIQNEMRYRKRLLEFDLTAIQRERMQEKIATLRLEFADDVVHRLSHRKSLPMDQLMAQFRLDPATMWMLPIHAGQIVARRLKGRSAG